MTTELEKNQRRELERMRSVLGDVIEDMVAMAGYVPPLIWEQREYGKGITYAQKALTHVEGFLCITTHSDGADDGS